MVKGPSVPTKVPLCPFPIRPFPVAATSDPEPSVFDVLEVADILPGPEASAVHDRRFGQEVEVRGGR